MDTSKSGSGHPLPASDEARHDEIPEDLVGEKGFGDDDIEHVAAPAQAAAPDGELYPRGEAGQSEDIEAGIGDGRDSPGPGTTV